MNYAETYKQEKMKNETFRKAYFEEKMKLDIEIMLDELVEKIKKEESYKELLKGVNKIKRKLVKV